MFLRLEEDPELFTDAAFLVVTGGYGVLVLPGFEVEVRLPLISLSSYGIDVGGQT